MGGEVKSYTRSLYKSLDGTWSVRTAYQDCSEWSPSFLTREEAVKYAGEKDLPEYHEVEIRQTTWVLQGKKGKKCGK